VELAAAPYAARDARRAAREVLTAWAVPEGYVDDALLVVSELVANAVRHAHTVSTLELELSDGGRRLRVALADGSSTAPRLRHAHYSAEDGRGMGILAALSDRWGIELHVGGKRVWWEVELDPAYEDSATARLEKATASA
jgi:anti-sigma regulatory factor (Ser/Thr protein kinase)